LFFPLETKKEVKKHQSIHPPKTLVNVLANIGNIS